MNDDMIITLSALTVSYRNCKKKKNIKKTVRYRNN